MAEKFRDPETGREFADIFEARKAFCTESEFACAKCPMRDQPHGPHYMGCYMLCQRDPIAAAMLMGFEVVGA